MIFFALVNMATLVAFVLLCWVTYVHEAHAAKVWLIGAMFVSMLAMDFHAL